jgi:peroxin-5
MQNSDMPPDPEEFARWEAEFNQLMNAQREDGEWDFSGAMQHTWEGGVTSWDDTFAHSLKLDHEGFPILDPYVFGSFSLPYDFSATALIKHRGK